MSSLVSMFANHFQSRLSHLSNCWNPTWSTIILKFFFFFFSVENVLSFFRCLFLL